MSGLGLAAPQPKKKPPLQALDLPAPYQHPAGFLRHDDPNRQHKLPAGLPEPPKGQVTWTRGVKDNRLQKETYQPGYYPDVEYHNEVEHFPPEIKDMPLSRQPDIVMTFGPWIREKESGQLHPTFGNLRRMRALPHDIVQAGEGAVEAVENTWDKYTLPDWSGDKRRNVWHRRGYKKKE